MEYLRLFERDAKSFDGGALAYLPKAYDVCETREINEDWTLEFKYPLYDARAADLETFRIVVLDGQGFRICRITELRSGSEGAVSVYCRHVFFDLEKVHVPTIEDMPGVEPYEVLEEADEWADEFTLVASPDGCIDFEDGLDEDFKIDWWTKDKTNVREVLDQVIEYAGCGEIYIDNFKYGLCYELGDGEAKGIIYLGAGLDGVEVESDAADMITRLWAYGENDLTVSSVNPTGEAYIESDDIDTWGVFDGWVDFSDETDPDELYNMAKWQFDERNAERLDAPAVTISGTLDALGIHKDLSCGDTVRVYLKGADGEKTERTLRVIRTEKHPFEPNETTVTIGRMKKDLYLYMRQFNKLGKYYNKVSNSNGDVTTGYLSGVVCTANNVVASDYSSDAANLTISDELITIKKDGVARVKIGNDGSGAFRFCLKNADGDETVDIDDDGNAVFKGTIEGASTIVEDDLILRTINGNGDTLPSIQFQSSSGETALKIYATNDGSVFIQTADEDASIYLNKVYRRLAVLDIDIEPLESKITALKARVTALEGGDT